MFFCLFFLFGREVPFDIDGEEEGLRLVVIWLGGRDVGELLVVVEAEGEGYGVRVESDEAEVLQPVGDGIDDIGSVIARDEYGGVGTF